MSLPFPIDPLVIFGALLAIAWVSIAVVGFFWRPWREESADDEDSAELPGTAGLDSGHSGERSPQMQKTILSAS
jgi:hypothetical protein